MKEKIDKMANRWNGKSIKWLVHETASLLIGGLTRQNIDKIAGWFNSKLMKRPVDEMAASWQNDKLMIQQVDKMPKR